jgi:murein DD-endopeptidase MepM/ murein hydrolase activator NlpD
MFQSKAIKIRHLEKIILALLVFAMLFIPLKDSQLFAQKEALTSTQVDLVREFKTNRFMSRITTEINSVEDDLLVVNREIAHTEESLEEALNKIDTLQAQINNLDLHIAVSEKNIENIENQIAKKQSDIDTLEYQIAQKKIEVSYQKQLVLEYLRVLFKDQAELNTWNSDEADLNTLKLLLSNNSTGEKLRSIRYSEVLESQGREIFNSLESLMEEQEVNQKILEVRKHNLLIYHQTLSDENNELDIRRKAKDNLLVLTKGEEEVYQQLLLESKREQEDVLLEVGTLRKNLVFIQDRVKQLGDSFNPDDYADLLSVGDDKLLLSHLIGSSEGEDFSPIWPVNPGRGITAYYREASYARIFGMQHNAIDLRASQGTLVKSAADGVVYKAEDNGYGYSYVMVAHYGGYMTLYGHISRIVVEEGDEVRQGDVIGLSGGIPGTKGAGIHTTGAHLHFEILKEGLYTDPLDSLNLAYLAFDSLPEKYVAKALGDRKKVRRDGPKKVRYNSASREASRVKVPNPSAVSRD